MLIYCVCFLLCFMKVDVFGQTPQIDYFQLNCMTGTNKSVSIYEFQEMINISHELTIKS